MNSENVCETCDGDGRETCTNPDHGFINAVGGEIGRLGCPCCGHDPYHKVINGGVCIDCNGTGLKPDDAALLSDLNDISIHSASEGK